MIHFCISAAKLVLVRGGWPRFVNPGNFKSQERGRCRVYAFVSYLSLKRPQHTWLSIFSGSSFQLDGPLSRHEGELTPIDI